ncbi:DUF6281 family protein [Streptomyces prasinopilosus]|uniref:Secreted protein n=1 Tax=Streptomyces prasinopilosus TaxID=67344 RepID=A0A1G6IAX6_9ACTN|nr:DUF6281 family protein [Streptomyces prasinopilosus]SDC03165.1 hypothetical protein SAMN05216505_101133 [Streptomyces prasinopilosus]
MRTVVPVGRGAIVRVLVAAVTVAVSAACASSSGGGSEASCEYRVEYDKRMYSDVSHAEFKVGEKLGPAVFPPCEDSSDDGGGQASPDSTVAHAIEGVDPSIAISVDDAPDGVLFVAVDSGNDLPSEVKKLIKDS